MAFEIKRPTHEQGQSVNLGADEEKRIQDALYALATDPHAPREISVKLTLHIHHEYPKHVQVGGETVVVNNSDEEKEASAGVRPKTGSGVQGSGVQGTQRQAPIMPGVQLDSALGATESRGTGSGLIGGVRTEASSGPRMVEEADSPSHETAHETGDFAEMNKAERKEELGGMTKAELRDLADQHDVHTDSSMNKGKITSALNKQLNKEAKTGTE